MKIAATVLILAFVGWGALFLSNSAILIQSETVRRNIVILASQTDRVLAVIPAN